MIAFVRGPIFSVDETSVVIDVQGVGYRVGMSGRSLGAVATESGEVKLLTYTHVREDTFELFGFLQSEELAAFKILIGISGIGPRLAMQILGAISPGELGSAVATNDLARLKSLPGVGKKTAERLIVELRDKPLGDGTISAVSSVSGAQKAGSTILGEIRSAMENLGYRGQKLERALEVLGAREDELSLEEGIREALFLLR